MKEEIVSIINSENFKNRFNAINENFSNLKQESLFRNSILENLILKFERNDQQSKAFAEHPRDKNG